MKHPRNQHQRDGRICRDFIAGGCSYPGCKFVHEHPPAGTPLNKTSNMCHDWVKGRCVFGAACKFQHGSEDGMQQQGHRVERRDGARHQPQKQQQSQHKQQRNERNVVGGSGGHGGSESKSQLPRTGSHKQQQDRYHPYERPSGKQTAAAGGPAAGRRKQEDKKQSGALPRSNSSKQDQQQPADSKHRGGGSRTPQTPTDAPQPLQLPPPPKQDLGWDQAAAMQQQPELQEQPRPKTTHPALDRARFICCQLSSSSKALPLLTANAEELTLAAIQSGALFRRSPFADSVEQYVTV